jgi:methyl-accepting chemotaxis protein
MAAKEHTYKRRQVYVKKDFQFRFMLRFCLVILVGAGISTALLLALSQGTLTSSFQDSRLVVRETSMAILPAVLYTNLITLALISLASIAVTLFVSHKIAGPLYRFELELNRIAQGDLTREVHLRQHDQITDIAKCLNTMTGSLNDKVGDIRTTVDELAQAATDQQDANALARQLTGLGQKIDTAFKLEQG